MGPAFSCACEQWLCPLQSVTALHQSACVWDWGKDMHSSSNAVRQKLLAGKEGGAGLAEELVLIHSNSGSHWLSLFQLARCFHILSLK